MYHYANMSLTFTMHKVAILGDLVHSINKKTFLHVITKFHKQFITVMLAAVCLLDWLLDQGDRYLLAAWCSG